MTRPINADVPTARPTPKRRRKPIPAALKAVAGLFLLAVVFVVAAILGGGGGNGDEGAQTPSVSVPASTAPEVPATEGPAELAYPAFATSNTTRVGGTDPASTAAAVALAAFPSTKPSQRPSAIALVDAAEWPGGIAAAALTAAPLGVPVLVGEDGELPEPTEGALEALDPQGSKETKGIQVFAVGAAAGPSDLRTRRVGTKGGAAAAAAIAALREELLGEPPRHFVVASASQPAFAMPAAAWAARSGDPVLFAEQEALPPPTAAALRRYPKVPVYVLGPSSAISSQVVRRIGQISRDVSRVSGEDPVANAIAFARYADGGFGWNINDPGHGFVVARSEDPLDAAAAAPLSASGTWGPLLLTDRADTIPAALRGYLLDVKPGYTANPTRAFYNHVWVIGDEEAIDVNQQAEIDELAELAKIGGAG